MILKEEQRAMLTLLAAASTRGITLEALNIAIADAGFDLTADYVRATAQKFAARRFAEFRDGRWYVTAAGKKEIAS